jgi:hypothetical protein
MILIYSYYHIIPLVYDNLWLIFTYSLSMSENNNKTQESMLKLYTKINNRKTNSVKNSKDEGDNSQLYRSLNSFRK